MPSPHPWHIGEHGDGTRDTHTARCLWCQSQTPCRAGSQTSRRSWRVRLLLFVLMCWSFQKAAGFSPDFPHGARSKVRGKLPLSLEMLPKQEQSPQPIPSTSSTSSSSITNHIPHNGGTIAAVPSKHSGEPLSHVLLWLLPSHLCSCLGAGQTKILRGHPPPTGGTSQFQSRRRSPMPLFGR